MPAERDNTSRIVVGVDGSALAEAALRWAIDQAGLTGASVEAVMAWKHPAAGGGFMAGSMAGSVAIYEADFASLAEKAMAETISKVADVASTVPLRSAVVAGEAAEVLLDAARDADLLVIGSDGHGEFVGGMLGSVSQHCVHHSRCPVVVIRG
jgi:nucleotide-binding universal stress UspA family protein